MQNFPLPWSATILVSLGTAGTYLTGCELFSVPSPLRQHFPRVNASQEWLVPKLLHTFELTNDRE